MTISWNSRGWECSTRLFQTHLLVLATHCARGLQVTFALQGECRMRAAPAISCAMCTRRCAHEHTGQRRQSDIPCAMALRLISRSPRRRIHLVTVAGGLSVHRKPGWVTKTSADLTPATGARTTRFCRTPQRRSSARCYSLTGKACPAITLRADAAASTATRPNVRDDGQRPSSERDGESSELIWGQLKTGIFSSEGIDSYFC